MPLSLGLCLSRHSVECITRIVPNTCSVIGIIPYKGYAYFVTESLADQGYAYFTMYGVAFATGS